MASMARNIEAADYAAAIRVIHGLGRQVEAPRQLFPFARAVVAECVRDGGFPPLLIHPVDFMALFQQRAAEQTQTTTGQAGATEASADAPPQGNGEQKFEFEL